MRALSVFIAFCVASLQALVAGDLHTQVLYTQVRVSTSKAGGSGTVVYSAKAEDVHGNKTAFYSTYIITCHHVVEDALKVETKWSPLLQRDVKLDRRQPVTVEFFNWKAVPHGRPPLTSGALAEIVSYDSDHDMALLYLKLAERPIGVASSLLPESIEAVQIGKPVFAVGCALGHDPILTFGHITHMGDSIDYKDYWMSSANIIFGNSGGAVFAEMDGKYYFLGIPSRVAVTWTQAVTHMGYFSPIRRVYEFYNEQLFHFLTPGSTHTEDGCSKERKARKDADEKSTKLIIATPEKQPEPEPPQD